jgi:prepilin-type processing-associated H-X9-DG protein
MCRLGRMISSGMSLRAGLTNQVEPELVSIVVPAHNEERVIATCVDALMAQDWPLLEILVVADRCTDATESIVSERVAKDDRVKLISNRECPPTWAGKCHAARLGAEHASGRWVAFIDADTSAAPELIGAAVTEASRRDTAMLSLLTDLTCHTWFERSTQPVAMMALLSLFPPDSVNRDDRRRTFANGQFMLFARESYDAIGGHASVKEALLEDIAFAQTVTRHGGRVNVLRADGLLSCSMYGTHEDFLRGWMRIFLEATGRSLRSLAKQGARQLWLGVVLPLLAVVSAVLGAIVGGLVGWVALGVGIGAIVLQAIALVAVYRIGRQPVWAAVLFPIGAVEVWRVMRQASKLLRRGEPVRWGGREYVLEPRD